MNETCFEVQTTELHRAREVLEKCPGVVGVEPSGAVLHLFLAPSVTSPEALRSTLASRGLERAVFRQIVPSLEDVFIALVRKAAK